MKYVVFTISALGVLPLAFLLFINRRWIKYAFWAMVGAMCCYIPTSINFFSNELYRGSARGMEVSVIHLLAFAVLLALAAGRRLKSLCPDWGFRLYILYFLLCLPSLRQAEDCMIAWYEIWKMIMLYIFYLAVYGYLKATDDLKSVLQGLAAFAIGNMLVVVKEHYSGMYQPHGFFPHQNGMAVSLHLFGPMFFAAYLMNGFRTRFRKLCTLAFICSAAAVVRSYSRGALAMLPIAYGMAGVACIWKGRPRGWLKRLMPIVFLGMLGGLALLPRLVARFLHAPESSGNTRIELALCAKEMIVDKPWTGVGINNWGIKINPPYEYAELAGRRTNRGEEFRDGIVETVYLLVAAECGIPALVAMLCWFGWYLVSCVRLLKRLRGTQWLFIPAGLLGGLTAAYIQGCLEWVLRQQLSLICLMFMFAMLSYLNASWSRLAEMERKPADGRGG